MQELKQEKEVQYDNIPVIYCKSCLSLKITNFLYYKKRNQLEEGIIDEYDFCDECGSTDLGVCSIQEYQEIYKQRFGYYPLETY